MQILNRDELHTFFENARKHEQACYAVKGPAPANTFYEDGEPITQPINVKWINAKTGEEVVIIYS